jgi:hypothetical protein
MLRYLWIHTRAYAHMYTHTHAHMHGQTHTMELLWRINYLDSKTKILIYSLWNYWSWTKVRFVGFEVLMAVVMKNSFFGVVTPCSSLKVSWHFGGTCFCYCYRHSLWTINIFWKILDIRNINTKLNPDLNMPHANLTRYQIRVYRNQIFQ